MIFQKKKQKPTIQFVFIADLFFILLVFSMVSLSSNSTQNIELDLPKSTFKNETSSSIKIHIDSEKNFFIENKKIEFEALKAHLLQSLEKSLTIAPHKSVPIETVIKIASIAAEKNMRIDIATQYEKN